MTTNPDGELVPAENRLAEIHDRYGPGHLVSRSIQRATPMIPQISQPHRDHRSLAKILCIASAPAVMTGRIWWR